MWAPPTTTSPGPTACKDSRIALVFFFFLNHKPPSLSPHLRLPLCHPHPSVKVQREERAPGHHRFLRPSSHQPHPITHYVLPSCIPVIHQGTIHTSADLCRVPHISSSPALTHAYTRLPPLGLAFSTAPPPTRPCASPHQARPSFGIRRFD